MKLSLTDKFLWNLYNRIESLDRGFDLFAPRTLSDVLLPEFFKLRQEYERQKDRINFSKLIYYLRCKGYIKRANLSQGRGAILTAKGTEKILKIKLVNTKKKKRPDGKWQMVIFDIPEKKRVFRDILREALVNLGYQKFQVSVWVCPYDVFEETQGVIRRYSLDSYVKLFLIEEVEA